MIRLWATLCCVAIGASAAAAELETIAKPQPAQSPGFERAGVVAVWEKYADRLTFGRGQTIALIDDGCKPGQPMWTASNDDGRPKMLVSYDAVDQDDDAAHGKRGYHGSTIGIPSSLNFGGKRGVAFNNQIAIVRSVECCHCKTAEAVTLARALQWVIDNHEKHNITTVNLAPVDDQAHAEPVSTDIDDKLAKLRELGIWVSVRLAITISPTASPGRPVSRTASRSARCDRRRTSFISTVQRRSTSSCRPPPRARRTRCSAVPQWCSAKRSQPRDTIGKPTGRRCPKRC
ncbi:MAG: hypothetical protein QM775_23600 [Pirellulales bacterium]